MPSSFINKIGNNWILGGLNTFINPFSYMMLRKSPELVKSFDAVMVDGQLLVVFFKLLGIFGVQRKSFDMTSLAGEIFEWAVQNGRSVYLVGTTEKLISEAVNNICAKYPDLKVVGYNHGFLESTSDREHIFSKIRDAGADIVVAGMGTPKQEEFLIQLKTSGWQGTGFTCGGFFHQTASGIQYYPRWADRLNLRWLYRIYDEPKLFSRYFIKYPIALILIAWDFKFRWAK